MVETYVSNKIFNADCAYIYIWFSIQHKIVYVGMTNQRVGTIGRAAQHLDKNGTLRKRFEELLGYSINLSDDLILYSFILPKDKKFTTVEKSYREAVEYLVQKKLLELKTTLKYSFEVISWVRSNERTSNSEIINISNTIIQRFCNTINAIS